MSREILPLLAFPTLLRYEIDHFICDSIFNCILRLTPHRGCSPYNCLQAELGDVVYVEIPPVGDSLTQGETFGVVESVKVCFCRLDHQL
jgi:hypothetical protein